MQKWKYPVQWHSNDIEVTLSGFISHLDNNHTHTTNTDFYGGDVKYRNANWQDAAQQDKTMDRERPYLTQYYI